MVLRKQSAFDIPVEVDRSLLRKHSMTSSLGYMIPNTHLLSNSMQDLECEITMRFTLPMAISHRAIIMVDVDSGEGKAVLDWDRAGWYPGYWDHRRILSENPGLPDYFPYLKHIAPFNYAQEVLAMGYLLRLAGDG
ncbi:hypothetical protein ACJ73_08798 [Blastomyces percursus]|uniref:Aminoglycoside phosphotransferase domain-containing protein n=1 Tax=Blastomyces percursus TaxID=1658174 RepID=A0A1J9PMV8_9EURO|nr:hypothetical protein ACJ73_08798 [Blastomyces percursus]